MNDQQNIDDILKLLKSSYSDEGKKDDGAEKKQIKKSASEDRSISHEELQKKLKREFMSGKDRQNSSDTYESDSFSYTIDSEFMGESFSENDDIKPEGSKRARKSVKTESEDKIENKKTKIEIEPLEKVAEKVAEERIAENVIEELVSSDTEDDGIPPFDLSEDISASPLDRAVNEDADEIDIPEAPFEDEADDVDDGIFMENDEGELVFVKLEKSESASEDEVSLMLEDYDGAVSEDENRISENIPELEETEKEEVELFSDESGQLTLFEENITVDKEAEDEQSDISDALSDDESQIAMDFSDPESDILYEEDEASTEEQETEIDDSVLELMFAFGDKSFIGKTSSEKYTDISPEYSRDDQENEIDPSEAFAFDGEEYKDSEQTEDLFGAYRSEKLFTLLRILGCGVFAFLLGAYELLCFFGAELEGLLDYTEYPAVHVLIGIQLMILSAFFAWRELFKGMKKLFTFKADRWSTIALVLLFVLLHGALTVYIDPIVKPTMFCTVAVCYIFFGLITEYISLCREVKTFDIYSSDEKKFTFSTKARPGSAADKMYRSGVPHEMNIFEPTDIDFPKRYFSAVNRSDGSDVIVNYSITPIVVLSTLALIVSAILENPIEISMNAFMMTLTALVPISAFAAHTFPIYKMSSRLYRRQCAVAGEAMALKYAKCDYMIFNDMHLFKSAEARDNGIVIYDEKNTRTVVEYLGALYNIIGGPMKNVFGNVSESKETVKLRRIARNGVEGVINGTHSLILGDADFLRRYGIFVPSTDTVKNGEGILVFAIDGRVAAKLCLNYKTEPIFEMLIQRLAENGVKCAIETYDPVINSIFVAKCRKQSRTSVNVIHNNVTDYYGKGDDDQSEDTGLVVCSSRLKLVETTVWCMCFKKALRMASVGQLCMSLLACVAIALLMTFGLIGYGNQYFVMLYQAFCMLPVLFAMSLNFPSEDHFTLEAIERKNKKI